MSDWNKEKDLLGRARVVRVSMRGRGGPPARVKASSLSLAERLRAVRGVPQAVAKITRFQRTASQCSRHWTYISRKGILELETEEGELLKNLNEQKELLKAWELTFDHGKKSRDQMNYTVSAPKGSSPEAVRNAAREFGKEAFAGHKYVFALHTDKDHPHVHFAVHMKGPIKKLNPRLKDLRQWRELWAEKARSQGIEMACSPRAARGVGRKGQRQAIQQMQSRGVTPEVTKHAVRDALATKDDTGWERYAKARNQAERQAYRDAANSLRTTAQGRAATEANKLNAAATELEQFAQRMPVAKTRRQQLREAINRQQQKTFTTRKAEDRER
ncbi:MAG: relaxase/mobilization nuclease domain-containing protein [Sulfuricaulis sp.]